MEVILLFDDSVQAYAANVVCAFYRLFLIWLVLACAACIIVEWFPLSHQEWHDATVVANDGVEDLRSSKAWAIYGRLHYRALDGIVINGKRDWTGTKVVDILARNSSNCV